MAKQTGKPTTQKKKAAKKPKVGVKTVRHTLYVREDYNDDFLILSSLKISDFTKRVNLLIQEDVAKHRTEIDEFKNRKK